MNVLKSIKWFCVILIALVVFNQDAMAQKSKKKRKGKEREEIVEIVVETKSVVDTSDPCHKGVDPNEVAMNYSLYREFYKQDNYVEAMPYWKWIFYNAPGFRETPYNNGDKMYKHMLEETEDPVLKQAYFDTLQLIWTNYNRCFGSEADLNGKMGFLYLIYKPEEKEKTFEYMDNAIEMSGNDIPYYIIKPYFTFVVDKFNSKEYATEDVQAKYDRFASVVEENVANGHKNADKYEAALASVQPIVAKVLDIEAKGAVSDCASAIAYYEPKYRADPSDLATIKKLYGLLAKYKCTSSPMLLELARKLYDIEATAGKAKLIASSYYSRDDFPNAMSWYNKANLLETDPCKKAKLKISIGQILQYKQKRYGAARTEYNEAAKLCPSNGKSFLNIGLMYASSGKKCGPGTGWDSQVVIWPAMDMWYKAKQADPNVAAKAQEYINKYTKYLPAKEDAFMRGAAAGSSYTINNGCWMDGISTTVRLK